jgi:hypothetical protein
MSDDARKINNARYHKIKCCTCNTCFFVSADIDDARLHDGESFWCPNGHCMIYRDACKRKYLREVADLKSQKDELKTQLGSRDRIIETQRRRIELLENQRPSLWRRMFSN